MGWGVVSGFGKGMCWRRERDDEVEREGGRRKEMERVREGAESSMKRGSGNGGREAGNGE